MQPQTELVWADRHGTTHRIDTTGVPYPVVRLLCHWSARHTHTRPDAVRNAARAVIARLTGQIQ